MQSMDYALNVKVNVSVDKFDLQPTSLWSQLKSKTCSLTGAETGNTTSLTHHFGFGFFVCKLPLSPQKLTTQDLCLERQHNGITCAHILSLLIHSGSPEIIEIILRHT